MKTKDRVLAAVFILFFISFSIFPQTETEANIKKHLEVLANDSLQGRGTGTIGGSLAANYIAEQFRNSGLTPLGDDNTYLQNIPMHGSYPLSDSKLTIYYDQDSTIHLNLNEDYFLYSSGQQTFVPKPLELVFVGYGIVAPEFDYNDYQSVNVEGKIAVFLEGEPESKSLDYFDGDIPTIYSYPVSKQRIALSRGAAGSILIPSETEFDLEYIKSEFQFEDITLAYSPTSSLSILINPLSAVKLFSNSKYSYKEILNLKEENKLVSFEIGAKISFRGEFRERDFFSANVAGLIEGKDKNYKDRYIIVSAHYDHLGIGTAVKGDSIYNGALDNAIGVAVLLELARMFSLNKTQIDRSIIFLATTGEEKGLLGSSYYIDHPLRPLYQTDANINIDGIAFFEDFQSLIPIGAEYSNLRDIINESLNNSEYSIDEIPHQFKSYEAFNRSDQIVFASSGIPSVLVLEGTKNKHLDENTVISYFIDYMIKRYHTPFDDLKQDINYKAAAQHSEVIYKIIDRIAQKDISTEWKAGSPFINARLRSIAEKR